MSMYIYISTHMHAFVHTCMQVGLGMNLEEMQANDDLTERIVHDLNARPQLPFADDEFDAVVCASAIQYLTQPEIVLAEVCIHLYVYIYIYI